MNHIRLITRFMTVVVAAVLVLGALPFAGSARAITFLNAPVYVITCTRVDQTNPNALIRWDRDTTGNYTEILRYQVTDGDGTVLISADDIRGVGDTAYPWGFSYTVAPDYNPIRFLLTSPAGNTYPEQVLVDMTGQCEGLPVWEGEPEPEPEPEPSLKPGCDVLMPIPSTAVGGTFVADAPAYWMPGELTSPLITIKAGNSARVIGLDASGQYYKIIWSCDFLWVPKGTIGPNYDKVWNGAPLPTDVVS